MDRNIETGLRVVSDKAFTNERLDIDGIEFRDCTISDCVLVYSGGDPFMFDNTSVERSIIQFHGKAEATLLALSAAYKTGMSGWVERMFDMVRSGDLRRPN